MFKEYSGTDYLLIDIGTHYGLDKKTFEERIAFVKENMYQLESLADKANCKPLFMKAVLALRKSQKGLPIGHLMGLDACSSGIQIMSAITGCYEGAKATGLIDPDKRADAYGACGEVMGKLLNQSCVTLRDDIKKALVAGCYGSKEQPKSIFGENTKELEAFYQSFQTVAPGAYNLLQDLLDSWRPYALQHSWILPDGFDVRIKVMVKKQSRIQVEQLDNASFTYEYYDNEGQKKGLANAANVIHSIDAYVMRSMHRRCNYDLKMLQEAYRLLKSTTYRTMVDDKNLIYKYLVLYKNNNLADIVILPYLTETNVKFLTLDHKAKLLSIVEGMLQYKPFELITIHDEFKAHPNNMNWVRKQYKEILADLADSNILDSILTQIYGVPGQFKKLSSNLGNIIRTNANYALC